MMRPQNLRLKLKSLYRHCLLALLTSVSFVATAQKDGLLWKVSGNGLTKPSYLFGTIHIHCNADTINQPALQQSLNSTDLVALEIDLNSMQVLVELYNKSEEPSPVTLRTYLSASEYHTVDSACRALLGDSLDNLDNKSPVYLMSSMMFSQSFLGCRPIPIDFKIAQMAKEAGKPTMGLEKPGFQDSLIKSIPFDMQVRWLMDFCRNISSAKADFQKLLTAYNSRKIEDIYKVTFETSPEMNELSDAMLTQRNVNWVNYLNLNMKLQTYFVAVGAAHLGGKQGLIALLRQAGYTVTAVKL
ncbi:MAG: TraB/GumN family protein [Bacteroidota bacterium]